MEWAKILQTWIATIAWPLVVVLIFILYRKQLTRLLSSLSDVAERAGNEAVEIGIGDKLKVTFGERIKKIEQESKRLKPVGTPGVDMPPFEPTSVSEDAPLPPNYRGKPLPPPSRIHGTFLHSRGDSTACRHHGSMAGG
jgi:hypothetical protein